MKHLYTLIFLILPLFTQAQNLPEAVAQQISAARAGQSSPSMQWSSYSAEEKSAAIPSLKQHAQDSSTSVRLKAYDLLYQLSLSEKENRQVGLPSLKLRQASLQAFLEGLNDNDRGVQGFVTGRMQAFSQEDYNEEMRKLLLQKLNPRPFYYEELVLTLAHIHETSAINPIINHLRSQSSEMSQMERWQAHIALAKLGEEPALNFVVRKAKELSVNDDIVYDIYPTLAFTHQKEAVDVLVAQVFSDQRNCSVPDTDSNQKVSCAYRILELIAPIIQDFPIATDEATGDLDVADYETALNEARQWLEENREGYVLVD